MIGLLVTPTASNRRIEAASGSYESRNHLNAAGSSSDDVPLMAVALPAGLTPYRRSMTRPPAPGGHDLAGWPMLMGVDEIRCARPDAEKLAVAPAEEIPSYPQDGHADEVVLTDGLARHKEMNTKTAIRVETNWAGLRSFAHDQTLILHPNPERRDFIPCAGQSGYGFRIAPAASQLLTDLAAGVKRACHAAKNRCTEP
jgi:D-arginine dehydrogenase